MNCLVPRMKTIFNHKKSASVYFISKTLKRAHLPNVYLNGEVILQVDSVKYLGHHLTNDLHYDDLDIRRQCRAINVRGNILFRKFHMCSVSVKLKFPIPTALLCILLTCGGTTRKCQFANNLSQHTQNEHRIV